MITKSQDPRLLALSHNSAGGSQVDANYR